MNKKIQSKAQGRSWKSLVAFLLLIALTVSALPNLFQPSVVFTLTPKNHQSLTIEQLQQHFNDNGIALNRIRESLESVELTIPSLEDLNRSRSLLETTYGNEVSIHFEVVQTMPKWLQTLSLEPIKLGLDLNGGVMFVLDVNIDQALTENYERVADDVKRIVRKKRIRGISVNDVSVKGIQISLKGTSEQQLIEAINNDHPDLVKKSRSGSLLLSYSDAFLTQFKQQTMAQSLKTMRGRIEELGITEAVTQRQGINRIRIELPGVHDVSQARRIIGATASLAFYQMASSEHAIGVKRLKDKQGRTLILNGTPVFTGSNIYHAQAGFDQYGKPLVNLKLDSAGGRMMSEFSRQNIGNPMVTVFTEYATDDTNKITKKSDVISVATISQQLGQQFSITNLSSARAAQELALLLRAGSLEAPVTIAVERSIEAKLGGENIDRGIKALVIGMLITLAFMAIWYRKIGLVANIALSFNLIALLGLMSLLPGAVLTLPGMAGFVLTVGMAVDTNVLIFERIKDEIKRGKSVLSAIESGYGGAFSTIFDANITTLITGVILYSIGYGPVKGFAITLCLGVLTSMFTGIFVSKILTNLLFTQQSARPFGGNI